MTSFYIRCCSLVLMMFLVFSCKHKKQEVTGVQKTRPSIPAKARPNGPGGHGEPFPHNKSFNESLGLTNKQVRESKLYSFINEWYGTPYRYGGCLKSGVDCSCFTSILYENVYGKQTPRVANDIFKSCEQLSLKEAREGDLVFFKINSKHISHVGVLLRNNYFIHASTSKGVVVNNLNEAYYKKFFFSAGRLSNS